MPAWSSGIDGRHSASVDRAVDQHEWEPGGDQLLDNVVPATSRRQQQPIDLTLEHERLVQAFLPGVVVGVGEHERVSRLGRVRPRRREPSAGRTGS